MTMRLSLEEVVRQHFGEQQHGSKEQDANMRRIKAEHLKGRGDDATKTGNYRLAWEKYSEALELCPDKDQLPALHSNRSLAYFKAQRYSDALRDADLAAQLAPTWHKAHWRRGSALAALKRSPEAVLAFLEAWRHAKQGEVRQECESKLWQAVQRLTREQLGRGILQIMSQMQEEEGGMEKPQKEAASELEQSEAMFRVLKAAHQNKKRPGPFYRRYMTWLQQGMELGEAYTQRAEMHTEARCYLQGRADAHAAVAVLEEQLVEINQQLTVCKVEGPAGTGSDECKALSGGQLQQPRSREQLQLAREELHSQLATAFQKMGMACMAERDHPDRDYRNAVKAFLRVSELDPENTDVLDRMQEASEKLTGRELEEVQLELYHEGKVGSRQALAASSVRQRRFQATVWLAFPSAKAADCSFRAREQLRMGVAAAAGVDQQAVTIERVLAPTAARQHLAVLLHVQVGPELLKASDFVKAVTGKPASSSGSSGSGGGSGSGGNDCDSRDADGSKAGRECTAGQETQQTAADQELEEQRRQQLAALLGGRALTAVLGLPEPQLCSGEVQDVTPTCEGASEAERAQQQALSKGEADVAPDQDRRLALPERPKMELELPYRLYRLTRADGTLVERVDKHPFCMSRVYYDSTEKPEEVWTELLDGSCRWRQTGGEVKVLALKVPPELPSRQLAVAIEPYSLKVWNRATDEVYLEGALERGIVPEECFWTHCGGEGEDGCAIYLRKMNLEVLQKYWQHAEMWWPRLFKAHGEIAWDDYEKDYSDLPQEVLQRHRLQEAIKEGERKVEDAENKKREMLQERDDIRKRARQERLAELRTGKKLSWVELDRMLP